MARTPSDTECASVSVTRSDSESGRVASGISPYGVSSFCTLGWGRRVTRVEWSSIYPVLVLQPVTGALEGDLGGLAAAVYPTGLCLSPLSSLPRGLSGL